MDISEKFCPVCKNKNERDAVVCRHCGAALDAYPGDAGGKTRTTDMPNQSKERIRDLAVDESKVPLIGISIYVDGMPNPIFLSADETFIIGRKAGEAAEPLLDLAPLGGYHLGLSRRHARIRRAEHGYEVIDLSSTNGTWLNDERLIPHKPYSLASGAQLRFGRMRCYVLYRSIVKTKQRI